MEQQQLIAAAAAQAAANAEAVAAAEAQAAADAQAAQAAAGGAAQQQPPAPQLQQQPQAPQQQPAQPQPQQPSAAEQELLALGQHAIDQARNAVRDAAALAEQARAGSAVAQPSFQLRDVFTRLSELSASDAAQLARVMQQGIENALPRSPPPVIQHLHRQSPAPVQQPAPLTHAQELARGFLGLGEQERQAFLRQLDVEEGKSVSRPQAAAAAQPAGKQDSKYDREGQHTQAAVASPFHPFSPRPPFAAASAPSSSLFSTSALPSMLDPSSQLGLGAFFKLLDIDKASKAPKLQSAAQYMQWRPLIAAFLQAHDSLAVVEHGSTWLSLPHTFAVQASRTAAMPLIEQGMEIGGPAHNQERLHDRHRLLFAHTALTHAVEGVPLALQAVSSVPMPNAQEAWRKLEAAMMPRSLGDRLLKEQEFLQLQQQSGETIAEFASRVQQLVTQLAALGSQHQDETLAGRFVSGIRSLEKSRRDLILSTSATLQDAINKAVNFETQERLEKQLKSGGRSQQQSAAESSSSAHGAFFGRKGQQSSNVKCFNCGKTGHMKKDCKAKPKQASNQSGSQGGGNNKNSHANETCTWCRKKGHIEAECKGKLNGRPRNTGSSSANAASADGATKSTTFASMLDARVAEFVPLSEQKAHSAHAAAEQQKGAAAPLTDVLLDTGATHNMMKSDVQLQGSKPLVGAAIRTAGKQVLSNPSVGQLQLHSSASSSPLQLNNVLQHPLLSRSLLSVSDLVDRPESLHWVFGKKGAQLIGVNGDVMLTGSRSGGLYVLDGASSHAATLAEQQQFHERLGHMGRTMLHKLIQSGAVKGIEHLVLRPSIDCESCKESKATLLPFKSQMPEQYRATRSLQRLHADLHGPIAQQTLSGARYSLVMLDEHSDFVWLEPLKSKDEAASKIQKIVKQIHTQFGVYPAEMHTDRGGEFLSGELADFYEEVGIKATLAPPYTPQLNGRAERMNRTLITATRAMIIAARAPKELWGEAICAAVVLHNRLKIHDDGSTPLQRLTGSRILTDIHSLHAWGCSAFVAVPPQLNKQKYDPTGVKMVFAGYEEPVGYRFLSMDGSTKVTVSRNAKFVEDDFSAMRAFSDSRQAADEGEEPDDWLDEAIWRNEQRLTIEESKREHEREQQPRPAAAASQPQRPLKIVAPRPQQAPVKRQLLARETPTPSPSPPLSESGSEYLLSDSAPPPDSGQRGRRRAKPARPPSAPPTRVSSRPKRGVFRLGMVDPKDIGSFPASILPADPTPLQIQLAEQIMADEIFGGQAGIPRGSSPYQEAQRQEAIEAEEKNQPFPLDRRRCNKAGEIVVSHRCIALKRDGEQCGARTRYGSRCWNHLQRDCNLRIKKSSIEQAGKGLWSGSKPVATKQLVTRYTGDISMDPDVDHGGSKYVVGLSDRCTIDAARTDTAPGRMINDPKGSGNRPNTRFAIDNRTRTVKIYATRPVPPKSEFFLPYGPAYWKRINELEAEKAERHKKKRKQKRAIKKHVKAAASAAALQQLFGERDPLTHEQAMASADAERWKEAERAEQKSLEDMKVYRFVDRVPADAKLLDSKPVYKRKRDSDGNVVRFKNRMVVRGFLQRASIDYDSTFAPTLSYITIRVMLAKVAVEDLELKTMDVETAFLHADLDRKLYMKIPASFTDVPAGAVALQLDKSLYGLHQAGKLWNAMLTQALIAIGFVAGKNGDMCSFILHSRSGRCITLGVFVDDIIYSYHKIDESEVEEIKNKLKGQFKIKDLGDATSILGMRIKRDRAARTLELDQEQYIKQCCALLGLSNSKPMPTPENIAASRRSLSHSSPADSDSSDDESSDSDSDDSDSEDISSSSELSLSNYRSAVGMLGYAALATRPDVAHAYSMAARQQQNPTKKDLLAIAHAFRYLLGTASFSLRYSNDDSLGSQLVAYCDSDWAGDSSDARSTSGILLKLGGAAVSWSSSKQSNVALSSSEAEYIAAGETAREIVAMRILLAELDEAQPTPTPLRIDSETAMRMALEEGNHGRRKHINVKHHYIRELVTDELVVLEWVPTTEQQADMLTKATSRKQFFAMRDLSMGHPHSASHAHSSSN